MFSLDDIPPGVDLCDVPIGLPPDGKTSNLDDPPSLAPVVISVMVTMLVLSLTFTGIRLYTNFKTLRWADHFNLFALIMAIGLLGYQGSQARLLRHMWDIPACWMVNAGYAKQIFVPALLVQLGAFFAKGSILFLYNQLFSTNKATKIATWVGHATNVVIYAAGIGVDVYYETPRAGQPWLSVLDGRTILPTRWWQVQAVFSLLLDLYIFVLPLPVITKLRLSSGHRLQLIAVFSLASLYVLNGIRLRCAFGQVSDLSFTSYIELTVAIIVCSAPAFACFARAHLSKFSLFRQLAPATSSRPSKLTGKDSASIAEIESGFGDGSIPAGVNGQLGPNHKVHYYELSEASTVRSWTSVNNATSPPGSSHDVEHGILRTVDVEQTVGATMPNRYQK